MEEIWGSLISAIGACGVIVMIKPYWFGEKAEPVLIVISLLAVAVIIYGLLVSVLAKKQVAIALEVLARRSPTSPSFVEGAS